MRFVITGEWARNRLLQTIVVLYSAYVGLLWITNALLYFQKMSLAPASVVAYYLGNEEQFLLPRTYQGLLEVAHFHLFAIGMLLLVLTHLMLFIPARQGLKAWLIALPFVSGIISESGGWLVRFVSPHFALVKIGGFLLLQTSLLVLVLVSLWATFTPEQAVNYIGPLDDEDDEDDELD
ncbi:MAG: hypothetical protein JRG96_04290 [Deltaproteobacteria bacterium]|nr:hypothetical protein [Deltaproteobacteria bacterium]